MTKFKYFFDFEKEEKWLMDMASQGHCLKKAGRFYYTFEPAQSEDATIRVDYRYFTWDDDYMAYLTMFEDNGWKHIAGKKRSGFQYFKRNPDCEDEHIYSDPQSRAERYSRMTRVGVVGSLFLLWLVLFGNADWMQAVWIYVLMIAIAAITITWEVTREIKIRQLKKKTLKE